MQEKVSIMLGCTLTKTSNKTALDNKAFLLHDASEKMV